MISISDDKRQPMPGANVELSLNGQITAAAQTDAEGKARLTIPGPGRYHLAVTKKDYLRTESTLLVEGDNQAQNVDVVLNPIDLSHQSISVVGTPSNPVAQSSSSQTTLPPDLAKQTPSKPATLTDSLPLIPGIVRAPDGSVAIAGYGETHSALLVNSVDVTDPSTGNFGLTVPIDSVETISVSEMPYLAQYGRFTAGVVTAETRRGGDKWAFSFNDPLPEFRIRSGHLAGLRDASPRINFSGPLVANKLYFLEGGEYILHKPAVRTLPYPDNATIFEAINSFTQLDCVISPEHTLTSSVHVAPHSLHYAGLNFFNPQPVTPNGAFYEFTGTLIDRLVLASGVLQSTLAGRTVRSEIKPQGNSEMILSPVGNGGNYFSQQNRDAKRFEWIENWTPANLHFRGDHTLQIGSILGHSENNGQFLARPVQIEDARGHLLERIDFHGSRGYSLSDLEPSVYAQDHWVLKPSFALDFGIRVEAQTITATMRTAPRAGFVWTPHGSNRTVLRGGIGVFYDSVPLDVYAFNRFPQQAITSYDSSGHPLGPALRFVNITQEAVDSRFPFIDRAEKSGNFAPYSVAWNLELEQAVTHTVTVRLKYLQSLAQGVITLQPEMVENRNAFVLGSSGTARTRQLELTAKVGSGERRVFFFSYVRQYASGDINYASSYLGNYSFPVVRQNLVASLPNEIPNRFLAWGAYALPRKFAIAPHLEYRSGFPYQPTDVLQQYVTQTQGSPHRYPSFFSLDLLISKDIQISAKHEVRVSAVIQNLTNHFNPLEVHSNVADPQFGTFFGNNHRLLTADFDFLF